jgi:hypothetical protein
VAVLKGYFIEMPYKCAKIKPCIKIYKADFNIGAPMVFALGA